MPGEEELNAGDAPPAALPPAAPPFEALPGARGALRFGFGGARDGRAGECVEPVPATPPPISLPLIAGFGASRPDPMDPAAPVVAR